MTQKQEIIYDTSFDIYKFIAEQKAKLEMETHNIEEMLKNAKEGNRGNGFVFTYNNFTHTPEQLLEMLQTLPNIAFVRFQIEKATDTGTIHYQGYMHFEKRVYWGVLRRELIKMGLHRLSHRNRIASPQKAAEYCSKVFDEKSGKQTKLTEPVYQFNELNIQQGERTDLNEIIERVKAGATNAELLEEYPTHFFRYKKHIESVRKTIQESEFEEKYRHMTVFYIHGVPRTGKTRDVSLKFGYKNICRVSITYDKWLFENYRGQKIVMFDEFDSQVPITQMNEYLEGHPQEYRCRNEDRVAMNDIVIIISNLKLSEQYQKEQREKPAIYKAFFERIHHIINWDNPPEREHFIQHGTSLAKHDPRQMVFVELTEAQKSNLPW